MLSTKLTLFEYLTYTCHGFRLKRVGYFLDKKFKISTRIHLNTCQFNAWDIRRGCRWPRFHKKVNKNNAFFWSIIILPITFEHSLYYLHYSLRSIINTYLRPNKINKLFLRPYLVCFNCPSSSVFFLAQIKRPLLFLQMPNCYFMCLTDFNKSFWPEVYKSC